MTNEFHLARRGQNGKTIYVGILHDNIGFQIDIFTRHFPTCGERRLHRHVGDAVKAEIRELHARKALDAKL